MINKDKIVFCQFMVTCMKRVPTNITHVQHKDVLPSTVAHHLNLRLLTATAIVQVCSADEKPA